LNGRLIRQSDGYSSAGEAAYYERIVLWFDACLFDHSMLAHVLACLSHKGIKPVELLCVDAFPGIEPFHGLGQLKPEELGSLYPERRHVADGQFIWGDTTLWARINGLADRVPPLVQIDGTMARLPQWESEVPLKEFKISALPSPPLQTTPDRRPRGAPGG
jgi:hypothetical protein